MNSKGIHARISVVKFRQPNLVFGQKKITIVLKGQNIDIKDTRFCYLDGTNSVSEETSGLQRRLCNAAPHSMYVNCRCN